jgi:hypothetical protein
MSPTLGNGDYRTLLTMENYHLWIDVTSAEIMKKDLSSWKMRPAKQPPPREAPRKSRKTIN